MCVCILAAQASNCDGFSPRGPGGLTPSTSGPRGWKKSGGSMARSRSMSTPAMAAGDRPSLSSAAVLSSCLMALPLVWCGSFGGGPGSACTPRAESRRAKKQVQRIH